MTRPRNAQPRARRRYRQAPQSFLREHSLSLSLAVLLAILLTLFLQSDSESHIGTFYGNAVGDWLGVLVFVIATKYFFEIGSGESRQPSPHLHQRIWRFLSEHSLTVVLAVSGLLWMAAYARADLDTRQGELLGNIVSDWMQLLGLVVLTKYAREQGSKEGQ